MWAELIRIVHCFQEPPYLPIFTSRLHPESNPPRKGYFSAVRMTMARFRTNTASGLEGHRKGLFSFVLVDRKGKAHGHIRIVALSPPPEREVDDLARCLNCVKSPEGFKQNRPLLCDVERFSERVPKRPSEKNSARGVHLFGEFTDNGDADGWDANTFDLSLDQSHGLIAKPSPRRKEDAIHCLCL